MADRLISEILFNLQTLKGGKKDMCVCCGVSSIGNGSVSWVVQK